VTIRQEEKRIAMKASEVASERLFASNLQGIT